MDGTVTAAALRLPPDRRGVSAVNAKYGVRRHRVEFWLVGTAGERPTIAHTPSEQLDGGALYKFRGDKFLAVDSLGGRGTFVRSIAINGARLLLDDFRRPTSEIVDNHLGGGICYPVCEPRSLISIEVEFVESCEWRAVMYGDAVEVPNEQRRSNDCQRTHRETSRFSAQHGGYDPRR